MKGAKSESGAEEKTGGGAAAFRDENGSDHQDRSGIRDEIIREATHVRSFGDKIRLRRRRRRRDSQFMSGRDFSASSASMSVTMSVFKGSLSLGGLREEVGVGTLHRCFHPHEDLQ